MIFILEIAGGAYAYAKRDQVETQLAKGVEKAVSKNYGVTTDTSSKAFTKVIDWFQQEVIIVIGDSSAANLAWIGFLVQMPIRSKFLDFDHSLSFF